MKNVKVILSKDSLDSLINAIKGINGDKTVTICRSDSVKQYSTFYISEADQIAYSFKHEAIFRAKLSSALISGGGVTVTQFIKNRNVKKLYGIGMAEGFWVGLPKAILEQIYCTDGETEKTMSKETDVEYCDFN